MRAALALLLLAVALGGCGGPREAAAARPDVDGCAGSRLRPLPANEAQVRTATLCLLNAQRTRNGCVALSENVLLDRAAALHSLDMAKRKYFEHADPDGVSRQRGSSTRATRRSSSARTSRGASWRRARRRTSSRCG
jgi:uncharacterized protein YkwD